MLGTVNYYSEIKIPYIVFSLVAVLEQFVSVAALRMAPTFVSVHIFLLDRTGHFVKVAVRRFH